MEKIRDIPNRSIEAYASEAYASSHVEIPKKKTEEVEREHVSRLSREDLELLKHVAKEMKKNGLDVDLKELSEVMEDPHWKEVIDRMSDRKDIPTIPIWDLPEYDDPLMEAMHLAMSMQTSFTKLAVALADFMRTKSQKINAYLNVLIQLRPVTLNDVIWHPPIPAPNIQQEILGRLNGQIRHMQETIRSYRSEGEEEAKLVSSSMQSLEQGSRKQADVFNAILNFIGAIGRAIYRS